MEPKLHFYLDGAISDSRVKELINDPEQKKEIESLLKNEPRQIWAFLTFLKNARTKVYTGERIAQVYWDKDRERVNPSRYKDGAHDFNQWLSKIENEILTEIRSRYRFQKSEPATKENIQKLIKGIVAKSREDQPDSKRISVLSHIQQYVESEKSDWSEGFTKIILSTIEHIKEFETWRKSPLQAEEDYLEVWRSFKNYLITKKLKSSTANKHLKLFRRIVRHLLKKGVIKNADLEGFKRFEEPETFHIALRQEEIDLLTKAIFKESHLDRARDLQLLQIYTGQRVGDLPQVVGQVNKSNGSLHVLQGKTNQRATIPIFPALETHLKKLRQKYPDGLPDMTEQKYNEYIKECAKRVNIDQIHTFKELRGDKPVTVSKPRYDLITTHTNRRTFCTICSGRGISHKAIMAITGHKSHKVFLEYVRVDDTSISQEFNEKMQ